MVLTLCMEWSLFPLVQEISQGQRQWQAPPRVFTIRFPTGTAVIRKEIALHDKQTREPLSLSF